MSIAYPSDLVDAKGNVYPTVGENIRRGYNDSATPQPDPPEPKEFGTIFIRPLTIEFSNTYGRPRILDEDGTEVPNGEYQFNFEQYYIYCHTGADFIGLLGIDWGKNSVKFGDYPLRVGVYGNDTIIDLSKVHNYNWVTGTFKIYTLELKR